VTAALDEGSPLTLIAEAVFARCLSAAKDERELAAKILGGETARYAGDAESFVRQLHDALYAAKIISYAQGYQLMRATAQTLGWDLDFGRIASTWRGGCIIRAAFLDDIRRAFERDAGLVNLMLDPFFADHLRRCQDALRSVVSNAVLLGIPVPCLSAALAYWDSYRSERLPANLLQAQRDYFGAHTYERTDRPRGEYHHTNWTGRGGSTTADQ
jgi:6-phosphogluconate dehydrogenase